MTAPTPDMPMISRSDAAPLMPEQVNMSMAADMSQSRRQAAVRCQVGGDGKVTHSSGKRLGTISKTSGLAWRARDTTGNLIGLHSSKAEAAGALVLRHEGKQ